MPDLFCRHDSYNVIEMLDRLKTQVLIKNVLKNTSIKNKEEAKIEFLNTYNENSSLLIELKNNFMIYGRKGDKANIKIFKVNKFKDDTVNMYGWRKIEELQGKDLSTVEILGSFFNQKCYLNTMIIENNTIDFRFEFQYEKSKVSEEQEVMIEIFSRFVEARFYLDKKLICITESSDKEKKAILNTIVSLPYYIIIQETRSYTYSEPDYSSITLTTGQLDSIKELLGGKLRAAVIEVFGDKGVKIKIEGNNEDFEKESHTYNTNKNSGNKEELQIFWKDCEGNENKITIKNDCQIVTTNYITVNALETIIHSIINTMKSENILKPVDESIRRYCLCCYRKAKQSRMFSNVEEKLNQSIKEIVTYLLNKNNIEYSDNIDKQTSMIAFNVIKTSLKDTALLEGEYTISNDFIFELIEKCDGNSYDENKRGTAINILESKIIATQGNLKKLVGGL